MGENYKPKIVKAKLKTGGKTVQSVREKLTGQGFTVRDFQHIIKVGEYFDGLEVFLSLWNWDNYTKWHLWNWQQEDDEKVMLAMYQAEQFHPYAPLRNYKNNFEQFKADWETKNMIREQLILLILTKWKCWRLSRKKPTRLNQEPWIRQ